MLVFFSSSVLYYTGLNPEKNQWLVVFPDEAKTTKERSRKMKKKLMLLLVMAGAAALFTGCSSLQSSNAFNGQKITASGTGVAHVSGYTSGLYLLWIPIFTGSASEPGSIAFNEDSCNVTAVTNMVTKKSKNLKASRTIDLVSSSSSMNIPVPFPYIFYWRTVTVSGNAVR